MLTAVFVVYGYFKVFVEDNFEEGRRWGDIALKILDPNSAFTPSKWNCILA